MLEIHWAIAVRVSSPSMYGTEEDAATQIVDTQKGGLCGAERHLASAAEAVAIDGGYHGDRDAAETVHQPCI